MSDGRAFISSPRTGSWLLGAGIFLFLAIITHFTVAIERSRQEEKFRSEIADETTKIVSRLEAELNSDVFLANGLTAMITAVRKPTNREIEVALRSLFKSGRHLRNVAIAPDNRISHVFPFESNRAAIGLYYPDVPEQWIAVKTAIDRRTTMLAGPVKLRQGGMGLISRTPVFLEDGSYWGLLSLVIDSNSLFRTVGLAPEKDGIRYALRGRDALGPNGDIFFGDPTLFLRDTVVHTMTVPGGTWQIAVIPVGGWRRAQQWLDLLELVGFGICAFLAFVSLSYQRGRLRLEASERRLRVFLQTTQDGVIVTDDNGRIQEFNQAAQTLFGQSAKEILGASIHGLIRSDDWATPDHYIGKFSRTKESTVPLAYHANGRRKDDSEFPAEVTVGEAKIEGRYVHFFVVRDITDRKAFEQKLVELATTDSLTGVANRRAITAGIDEAFVLAERHARPLSVLMIDVDHFKRINDSYGHYAGDLVLVQLARITNDCLRATDRLGRLGGEEFVALLPETPLEQAPQVAERLLSAVSSATVHAANGQEIRFTVSIGIASIGPDMQSAQTLIQQADEALYAAKAAGRNRYCAYPYNQPDSTATLSSSGPSPVQSGKPAGTEVK